MGGMTERSLEDTPDRFLPLCAVLCVNCWCGRRDWGPTAQPLSDVPLQLQQAPQSSNTPGGNNWTVYPNSSLNCKKMIWSIEVGTNIFQGPWPCLIINNYIKLVVQWILKLTAKWGTWETTSQLDKLWFGLYFYIFRVSKSHQIPIDWDCKYWQLYLAVLLLPGAREGEESFMRLLL